MLSTLTPILISIIGTLSRYRCNPENEKEKETLERSFDYHIALYFGNNKKSELLMLLLLRKKTQVGCLKFM